MSEFTPGPWEASKEPWQGSGLQRIVGSRAKPNRGKIAHIFRFIDEPGKETEANVHLIAAAPELYETLRLYLIADEIIEAEERVAELSVAREAAERALAKARGETVEQKEDIE